MQLQAQAKPIRSVGALGWWGLRSQRSVTMIPTDGVEVRDTGIRSSTNHRCLKLFLVRSSTTFIEPLRRAADAGTNHPHRAFRPSQTSLLFSMTPPYVRARAVPCCLFSPTPHHTTPHRKLLPTTCGRGRAPSCSILSLPSIHPSRHTNYPPISTYSLFMSPP